MPIDNSDGYRYKMIRDLLYEDGSPDTSDSPDGKEITGAQMYHNTYQYPQFRGSTSGMYPLCNDPTLAHFSGYTMTPDWLGEEMPLYFAEYQISSRSVENNKYNYTIVYNDFEDRIYWFVPNSNSNPSPSSISDISLISLQNIAENIVTKTYSSSSSGASTYKYGLYNFCPALSDNDFLTFVNKYEQTSSEWNAARKAVWTEENEGATIAYEDPFYAPWRTWRRFVGWDGMVIGYGLDWPYTYCGFGFESNPLIGDFQDSTKVDARGADYLKPKYWDKLNPTDVTFTFDLKKLVKNTNYPTLSSVQDTVTWKSKNETVEILFRYNIVATMEMLDSWEDSTPNLFQDKTKRLVTADSISYSNSNHLDSKKTNYGSFIVSFPMNQTEGNIDISVTFNGEAVKMGTVKASLKNNILTVSFPVKAVFRGTDYTVFTDTIKGKVTPFAYPNAWGVIMAPVVYGLFLPSGTLRSMEEELVSTTTIKNKSFLPYIRFSTKSFKYSDTYMIYLKLWEKCYTLKTTGLESSLYPKVAYYKGTGAMICWYHSGGSLTYRTTFNSSFDQNLTLSVLGDQCFSQTQLNQEEIDWSSSLADDYLIPRFGWYADGNGYTSGGEKPTFESQKLNNAVKDGDIQFRTQVTYNNNTYYPETKTIECKYKYINILSQSNKLNEFYNAAENDIPYKLRVDQYNYTGTLPAIPISYVVKNSSGSQTSTGTVAKGGTAYITVPSGGTLTIDTPESSAPLDYWTDFYTFTPTLYWGVDSQNLTQRRNTQSISGTLSYRNGYSPELIRRDPRSCCAYALRKCYFNTAAVTITHCQHDVSTTDDEDIWAIFQTTSLTSTSNLTYGSTVPSDAPYYHVWKDTENPGGTDWWMYAGFRGTVSTYYAMGEFKIYQVVSGESNWILATQSYIGIAATNTTSPTLDWVLEYTNQNDCRSTEQKTYNYVLHVTLYTDPSRPTITKIADAYDYKRTITIYNPNEYPILAYYTSNKSTSTTPDSSATWSTVWIAGQSSATAAVSDRSGWDDSYIVVAVKYRKYSTTYYYYGNYYSEGVTTSPSGTNVKFTRYD